MKRILWMALFLARAHAAPVAAGSSRGAQLFQTLSCARCHSLNGEGGKTAPDLGRRIDRNFTPPSLAATMWNHAPTMWAAMRAQEVRPGDLNEQAAADLFAYFYSVRFFETPGDAGRGKALFASKGCEDCHGLTATKIPETTAIAYWETLNTPISLAAAMWNHALHDGRGTCAPAQSLAGVDVAGTGGHSGLPAQSSVRPDGGGATGNHVWRNRPKAV
jgi:mono/diheme cytochrome c family protein